jgi:hypothetical protein
MFDASIIPSILNSNIPKNILMVNVPNKFRFDIELSGYSICFPFSSEKRVEHLRSNYRGRLWVMLFLSINIPPLKRHFHSYIVIEPRCSSGSPLRCDIEHPAPVSSSGIQYRESSIQHPISSIQHPVSSIEYRASNILYLSCFPSCCNLSRLQYSDGQI